MPGGTGLGSVIGMAPNLRTIDQSDDPDGDDWSAGFTKGSGSGMACHRCGALVKQTPAAAATHREWDATVLRMAGAVHRAGLVTGRRSQ